MKFLNFFNRVKDTMLTPTRRIFGMSGGSYVNDDTSMQASAFYRGVIYVSTQIAKLPWEVKDSKNNIIENDISYLLNVSPNDEMSAFGLKLVLIQTAIIRGNSYAEIERYMDGRPKALWPLNPNKVDTVRDSQGTLWYRVQGGSLDGKDAYLKPKDIFITRNFHTKDGFQGQGVIAYAMDTLGISLGADKFANALFANGGMPSGVLNYPGKLSDEAFKRLKETWAESNGGRKTGQTAILEDGVAYSPISHAPDVLQFLESRKFNVTEIARFLGIPPTKLFDSDSAKFNNIEHANLEVATDTLDAWCRNLESEADIKLLNGRYKGYKTELDLYAVFRGDMATRAEYFVKMLQTGAITPNEIREKEGMAGYPGGDRFFIASNNLTPQDRMDEVIDSQIAPKEISPPASSTPPADAVSVAARERLLLILNKN
jgi:HK97 family phage portal protein